MLAVGVLALAGVDVASAAVGVPVGVLVVHTSANVNAGGLPFVLSIEPVPHAQPSICPGLISLPEAPKLEYCQPSVLSCQYDQ